MEGIKKKDGRTGMILTGGNAKIVWDESNVNSLYANVAQVKAVQEDFMLLFGMTPQRQLEQHERRAQLATRVILSPFTAKRLLVMLNNVIREYETAYGLLDEKTVIRRDQRLTPSFCLPPFESGEALEKVGLLFQLLKNLNLRVGFERSFKVSERTLLGSRFLLAVEKNSIGQNPHEKILDICIRINMPKNFLNIFQENLPEANTVGFSIEENKTTCVVKAYLEFKSRYEEAKKKKPDKPEPYLSHLGFKWDVTDNTRSALTRYTCFPAFTVEDMLERLSIGFYRDNDRNPFKIVKGILDFASSKVGHDKFLYIDVNEENNPRTSFDINMYGANLRLKELYPFWLEMCRHYSIPDEQFHRLYDPEKNRIFGHLSGGIDRKGRDFLTVYFGE
jgi:hypothetical protein